MAVYGATPSVEWKPDKNWSRCALCAPHKQVCGLDEISKAAILCLETLSAVSQNTLDCTVRWRNLTKQVIAIKPNHQTEWGVLELGRRVIAKWEQLMREFSSCFLKLICKKPTRLKLPPESERCNIWIRLDSSVDSGNTLEPACLSGKALTYIHISYGMGSVKQKLKETKDEQSRETFRKVS